MRFLIGLTTAACLAMLALVPTRAADDADKDVQAVIDKAIKAHGGADKLAKFKAVVAKGKGTVKIEGIIYDYTWSASTQLPDKMRVEAEIDLMGNKIALIQVLNGDKGWVKVDSDLKEMDKDQLAEVKMQAYAGWVMSLAPLAEKGFKYGTLGESKIDGKEAIGVQVTRKDRREVNLYFDKKSGLLLKSSFKTKDALGDGDEYTEDKYFSDYKEVEGIQLSMKEVLKHDDKEFGSQEVTEINLKEKLDDATFAKP